MMSKRKPPYTNVVAASERLSQHADLINERFDSIPFTPFMRWLIDLMPEPVLDLLAEEFSLTVYEGWGLADSVDKKREMIRSSIELHRHKGTPYSIKLILSVLGFGRVQVVEGLDKLHYDGQGNYDGLYFYGGPRLWALYKVVFLEKTIANSQARIIKEVLKNFAPAHAVLVSLNFEQAPLLYNGEACYDGIYNYGSIDGD